MRTVKLHHFVDFLIFEHLHSSHHKALTGLAAVDRGAVGGVMADPPLPPPPPAPEADDDRYTLHNLDILVIAIYFSTLLSIAFVPAVWGCLPAGLRKRLSVSTLCSALLLAWDVNSAVALISHILTSIKRQSALECHGCNERARLFLEPYAIPFVPQRTNALCSAAVSSNNSNWLKSCQFVGWIALTPASTQCWERKRQRRRSSAQDSNSQLLVSEADSPQSYGADSSGEDTPTDSEVCLFCVA